MAGEAARSPDFCPRGWAPPLRPEPRPGGRAASVYFRSSFSCSGQVPGQLRAGGCARHSRASLWVACTREGRVGASGGHGIPGVLTGVPFVPR